MTNLEKLQNLLENMPRAYEDATHGIMVIAKKEKCTEQLIDFIEMNPNATSSDLQYYINQNIWKIPISEAYKQYIKEHPDYKE